MGNLSSAKQPAYVASCTEDAPGWQAKLQLTLDQTARGTRLKHNRHSGPLYVQKPLYPEGRELAHIYLLHPPGGIVMGDTLRTDVHIEPNAAALMTTPGANRFYGRGTARYVTNHNNQALQTQHNQLQVAAGASLEWLPLETLIYDGARARMKTVIQLETDARYIGWEFSCLGLPASRQPFLSGDFRQSMQLEIAGKPQFIDRLSIDDGGEELRCGLAGLQGHTVLGTLVAGPFPNIADSRLLIEQLRSTIEQHDAAKRVAITAMNGLIVARYLGDSANQGRDDFVYLWQQLRPALLQRKACPPRIWAT